MNTWIMAMAVLTAGCDASDSLLDLEMMMQFEGAAESSGSDGRKMARMSGEEEQFAFQRAISRIYEMQTDDYLAKHHERMKQRLC